MSIEVLTKRFGRMDGFRTGITIATNLIFYSIIATNTDVFDEVAIFTISATIFVMGALLEIPTGLIADRYSPEKSVFVGFWLDVISIIFMALAMAYSQGSYFAIFGFIYLFLTSLSNALVSGSYQTASLNWYTQKFQTLKSSTKEPPSLFLASYKWNMPIQIASSVLVVAVAGLSYYYFGHDNTDSKATSLLLITIVFISKCFMFAKIWSVLKDAKNSAPQESADAAPYLSVLKGTRPVFLTFIYSFWLIIITTIVIAKCYHYIEVIGFDPSMTWIFGAMTTLSLGIATSLISRFTFAYLSNLEDKKKLHVILPVIVLGLTLVSLAIHSHSSSYAELMGLVVFVLGVSVCSQGLRFEIVSNIDRYVSSDYKTTWISAGTLCASLLYGATSMGLELSDPSLSVPLLFAGVVIVSIIVMVQNFYAVDKGID